MSRLFAIPALALLTAAGIPAQPVGGAAPHKAIADPFADNAQVMQEAQAFHKQQEAKARAILAQTAELSGYTSAKPSASAQTTTPALAASAPLPAVSSPSPLPSVR